MSRRAAAGVVAGVTPAAAALLLFLLLRGRHRLWVAGRGAAGAERRGRSYKKTVKM